MGGVRKGRVCQVGLDPEAPGKGWLASPGKREKPYRGRRELRQEVACRLVLMYFEFPHHEFCERYPVHFLFFCGGDASSVAAVCLCPCCLQNKPFCLTFCPSRHPLDVCSIIGVSSRQRDQRGSLAALREVRLRGGAELRFEPSLHEQPRPLGRLYRAAPSPPAQDVPGHR